MLLLYHQSSLFFRQRFKTFFFCHSYSDLIACQFTVFGVTAPKWGMAPTGYA